MSLSRTKIYQSFSSDTTRELGGRLANQVMSPMWERRRYGAVVIALKGELGTGKTTFSQGFLRGLGLKKRAPSPTFVIMRRHIISPRGGYKQKNLKHVFHADAYRLKSAAHLTALGFRDVLADPGNIVLIEWAERAKKILPKDAIWVKFRHGKKENERDIMMKL